MTRIKWFRVLSIMISFVIYLFMQFHFFVWHYGIFDGRKIIWSDYSFANFIEIPVLILLLLLAATFPKKFYSNALVILLVLVAGEATFVAIKSAKLQPAVKVTEAAPNASPRIFDFFTAGEGETLHANILSREKNIIVILVDTLQSDFFEKIIENNPDVRNKMNGFILFRNSSGLYPYTTLTIPAILTGQHYKPGENISNYAKRVWDSKIDRILRGKGFSISSLPLSRWDRASFLNSMSQRGLGLATIYDIVLFRHVPHVIKPAVFNEHAFLLRPIFLKGAPGINPESDLEILKSLVKNSFVADNKPTYMFLHLYGMHPPALLDRNCNVIKASHKRVDIENQAYCIITSVLEYFEKLKELDVYDKSMILLIADTGSKYPIVHQNKDVTKSDIPEFVISSAHPVIAGKDFDRQEDLLISDAPVSLLDISKTILSRLNIGTEKMEGYNLFSIKENQDRIRSYFYYKGSEESKLELIPQMQEYVINGFIRDANSWNVGNFFSFHKAGNEVMSLVDFGDPKFSHFQDPGWSVESPRFGVSWTIANTAALIGKLPQKESIKMIARLSNPHMEQKVKILLNGVLVATWSIEKSVDFQDYSAFLKLSESEMNNINKIEFVTEKLDILSDKDVRKLGVLVDWVRFE
jgi:hypothetical protein